MSKLTKTQIQFVIRKLTHELKEKTNKLNDEAYKARNSAYIAELRNTISKSRASDVLSVDESGNVTYIGQAKRLMRDRAFRHDDRVAINVCGTTIYVSEDVSRIVRNTADRITALEVEAMLGDQDTLRSSLDALSAEIASLSRAPTPSKKTAAKKAPVKKAE